MDESTNDDELEEMDERFGDLWSMSGKEQDRYIIYFVFLLILSVAACVALVRHLH